MNSLPALRNDTVIARLEAARAALVEADTIQKTKMIADVAAAAKIYARRRELGKEAISYAQSVEIEAFRKLGEQLKSTDRNDGGRPKTSSKSEPVTADETSTKTEPVSPPTLKELGISKKTSSLAQQLAELPKDEFEAVRDGHKSIGQALAKASEKRDKPTVIVAGKKVEAAYDALKAKYEEALEKIDEMTDLAESAQTFEHNEEFKAMQILRAEVRAVKRRRDELMRENAELKTEVKRLRKKLEAKK